MSFFFLASEAEQLHAPSRNKFVCMKSMVCDYFSVEREIRAYDALTTASNASNSPGKEYVRHTLDQFKIDHADRSYHFLVHEPLGISVDFLQTTLKGTLIPFGYCSQLVEQMIQALEYLHVHANLIHAGEYFRFLLRRVLTLYRKDIQARNILLRIEDLSVLQEIEESELTNPSARKISSETAIFESCRLQGTLDQWFGYKSTPVLCDFGEARAGKSSHTDLIQPSVYRAPEVFLHLPWSEPVDIWNLGCMVRRRSFLIHCSSSDSVP